jgi:hypothetical protein
MNWKNVAHLIRVDMKSGRLIRGRRLTKYRESRIFTYLLYGGALALGLAVGTIVGLIYQAVSASTLDPQLITLFHQGLLSLFLSLPTLVLIYSLVFTMMQQIQRSGVKVSVQAPYWLPITWEEHTLASIVANLLGFLLVSIIFIGSAIIVVSLFMGQVAYAVSTFFALLASAFMASAITEIFRVLQVRFIGAVYKSSGRAAVWVRFVGSLLFFIVFYIGYFLLTSGTGAITFVQTVASAQSVVWFIPFVWLGMTLNSFINGLLLQAFVFMILSLLFVLSLFYATVILNRRFGLYEPPAITVSRGVYAPRTGLLGRLGFSTVEAALIRKDWKAFTRRRELMYIFVVPIVTILIPLMQSLGVMGGPVAPEASLPLFALVFLMPGSIMALSMGNLMIGEEGGVVWRIYSSPVSAESLVKSKYFFVVFFSALVTMITGTVGVAAFHPSMRAILIGFIESLLLAFALGAVSLANGIRGADFTELPRPRMIRTEWAIFNLIACFLVALVTLAPFVSYVLTSVPFVSAQPVIDPYQAVVISAVIAVVITVVAYKMALRNARELLAKAET